MGIIRNIKSDFEIYENQSLGILVAIHSDDVKQIKSYFKAYKGSSQKPNDKVKGHPFVMDEEHESLKIDFETTGLYLIKDLARFK